MSILKSIPYLQEIVELITREKLVNELKKERDEWKEKYLASIDVFNKHLKGQLVKSRGTNKSQNKKQ